MKRSGTRRGCSYMKRVEEVNAIYDKWAKHGLTNREIWRRYVWPVFGISERTMYNMLGFDADAHPMLTDAERMQLTFRFLDDEEKGAER